MSRYGNYPNPELCKKHGCFAEKHKISIVSCEGCNQQQQTINVQRAAALAKAVQYAKSKQVQVSIYQDPATREFLFIETQHAAGYPVLQTISPDFRLPA